MTASTCIVNRITDLPRSPLDTRWDALPRLTLAHFHSQSSTHRPRIDVQIAHSGDALHWRFLVYDRYVLTRTLTSNGPVCTDSCVELFVEPIPGLGYFNIEINAGGSVLCGHITDPTRTETGFVGCSMFSDEELASISIATTLPRVISPEIAAPLDWAMSASIPLSVFSKRLGRKPPVPGLWRANFFKCADDSSHPHWASWAPITTRLNFHVPECFGLLELR